MFLILLLTLTLIGLTKTCAWIKSQIEKDIAAGIDPATAYSSSKVVAQEMSEVAEEGEAKK